MPTRGEEIGEVLVAVERAQRVAVERAQRVAQMDDERAAGKAGASDPGSLLRNWGMGRVLSDMVTYLLGSLVASCRSPYRQSEARCLLLFEFATSISVGVNLPESSCSRGRTPKSSCWTRCPSPSESDSSMAGVEVGAVVTLARFCQAVRHPWFSYTRGAPFDAVPAQVVTVVAARQGGVAPGVVAGGPSCRAPCGADRGDVLQWDTVRLIHSSLANGP